MDLLNKFMRHVKMIKPTLTLLPMILVVGGLFVCLGVVSEMATGGSHCTNAVSEMDSIFRALRPRDKVSSHGDI